MKSRVSKRLRIAGLLVALIAFSALEGCVSSPAAVAVSPSCPPLPARAEVKAVHWDDRPELGGLLISYGEYRKLEENIIEYRREIAELRAIAEYYGSAD
jgi:hypothetical protein